MTSPPSQQQIDVALDALRSDASTWASSSDTAAAMKGAVEDLTLDSSHFGYLADAVGMTQAYSTIQAGVAELLTQASDNFERISQALKECAETYEREDEAGAHKLHNVHQGE